VAVRVVVPLSVAMVASVSSLMVNETNWILR
jgi:hypothetical protein